MATAQGLQQVQEEVDDVHVQPHRGHDGLARPDLHALALVRVRDRVRVRVRGRVRVRLRVRVRVRARLGLGLG